MIGWSRFAIPTNRLNPIDIKELERLEPLSKHSGLRRASAVCAPGHGL
jgi:hypothetical protein